ncbi:MAG TPA: hypothetical protein VMD91_09925 [Candidatus Sulfotelmatobacter sp.]|nr:hypothetical protein [Candidatus Sulfotelmatobacter sp.]
MRIVLLSLALLVATAAAAPAATPAPAPKRINVEALQPRSLLPKKPLHTEFVVEVNKYGQVTRVRSGKASSDAAYNSHTYGNALQMFIRTDDGRAISGLYRVTYDYNPKTARIRRNVTIVRAGGTDPNAIGAANAMMAVARKYGQKAKNAPTVQATPVPLMTINPKRLPDLPQVMKTPAP